MSRKPCFFAFSSYVFGGFWVGVGACLCEGPVMNERHARTQEPGPLRSRLPSSGGGAFGLEVDKWWVVANGRGAGVGAGAGVRIDDSGRLGH